MKKVVVIDGRSGRTGQLFIERIKAAQLSCEIIAIGTNAIATSAMLKAGAEAGATGSAMLVGVALGLYPSLEAAAERMVKVREVFQPRAHIHEQYEAVYQRYKKLYDAVRPLV